MRRNTEYIGKAKGKTKEINKKSFFFVLTIIIFFLLNGRNELYGGTWMGEELERLIKEARLKIGPFRIKTILFLNNAGYDSNVYGTPYDPIKDYTFTTGPAFYIYLPLKKRILFSVYESPQYVYFLETKRERTWNNYFNGEVYFVFNRFLFSFGRGFSDARERWNTEIDIRPRRKEDSVQGSVLWQTARRTSFSIRYTKANYDYENLYYERFNIRDQLNREENYVNFTGYYQLFPRTKFFLDFEYGFFNFENPLSFRNSKSYAIYGGFEFSPFGAIRGRINLGYKFFDSLIPERKDYRGIVGNTSMDLRLLRFFALRALYRRDIQFSLWYDNIYFLENRYGSGASVYLFRNIRIDYDYSLGRNTYPQIERELIAHSLWQKREDDYKIHSVGIYFRIKRELGIGVTLSKWIRDSNLDWEDDEKLFVGANLTYNF
ncbi:MAG: outer membrane beta-barrel protein [Acidobacteriota bacterium]